MALRLVRQWNVYLGALDNSITTDGGPAATTVTATAPINTAATGARFIVCTAASWWNLTGATAPYVALELVNGSDIIRLGYGTSFSIGLSGTQCIVLEPGQTIRFSVKVAGNGTSDAYMAFQEYSVT